MHGLTVRRAWWLRGVAGILGLGWLAAGCTAAASPEVFPTVAATWGAPGPAPALAPLTAGQSLDASASAAPDVGRPAPDLRLTELRGRAVQLGDFRGRPVLLNFFASWCGPCAKELPSFVAARERHKDEGLQLVLVNLLEDRETVQEFVERLDLGDVPVLLDQDGMAAGHSYRVAALPTSFFIDADGVIQAKYVGELGAAALESGLARIAAAAPAAADAPAEQPEAGRFCGPDGCP